MVGINFFRRLGFKNSSPLRDFVSTDAASLIARFSDSAYDVARQRARDARSGKTFDANRPDGHWDRVRQDIARRTGHTVLDTATRYLLR